MDYKQMSMEEVSVNRIRTIYKTLENYRKTSMALHNKHLPSVRVYALSRGDEVSSIARSFPDSPEVQRWARKFRDFMDQHNLSNDIQVE